LKRGTVATVAAGSGFGSKPRPCVILQDDRFDQTGTVLVALFTTSLIAAPLYRIGIAPTAENGLLEPSELMIDKLVAAWRRAFGREIGRLAQATWRASMPHGC